MHINFYKYILFSILISGCSSEQVAPVEELHPQYAMNHQQNTYVVRSGDTLYSIAFLYDENYEQLARANGISYPYPVHAGQVIHLTKNKFSHQHQTFIPPRPSKIAQKFSGLQTNFSRGGWRWPSGSQLLESNSSSVLESKGINILGQSGQSVTAAKDGVVAYSGDGLPGYGNLILIKHDGDYLTAYAFNSRNMVREGQRVHSGQQIATMGKLESGRYGTHFEIRYRGTAVNPMKFLPRS